MTASVERPLVYAWVASGFTAGMGTLAAVAWEVPHGVSPLGDCLQPYHTGCSKSKKKKKKSRKQNDSLRRPYK